MIDSFADKFCLVTTEKGKYLNPFRTQKSSPSSPMVLHTRVWESRSLPSFFFSLSCLAAKAFLFSGQKEKDKKDERDLKDLKDKRDVKDCLDKHLNLLSFTSIMSRMSF